MGRIKQGLDYFPVNTDFMQDRTVRRIMKQEGDAACTVLLLTLSYIFAGEGYYTIADEEFFDELSDRLFTTDNDRVKRIILLLVEYGYFDAGLYEHYGILTSAHIQQQYLFVTKRRSRSSRMLQPEYCLVAEELPKEEEKTKEKEEYNEAGKGSNDSYKAYNEPQNAYNDDLHKRKEKESIEQHNNLPLPPLKGGGKEEEDTDSARKKTAELTQQDIDRMIPPTDGCRRNLEGLLENLKLYHIPPAQQYAIIKKSNYGEIGGKVWQALSQLRSGGSKIKLPGHFLLSLMAH